MEQNQLGCKHYRRGCKLKANCCGRWFNCRFCHDDASDHTIVRSETKMMLCMHCQTIQEAAQNCSSCKARMAAYYCDICKLWDDDSKKHIYHCDDCGICRIGQGLGRDYFHCKKCNVCMNIQLQDNHKCIERNLECDCPICGEFMFTSTSTVIFMVSSPLVVVFIPKSIEFFPVNPHADFFSLMILAVRTLHPLEVPRGLYQDVVPMSDLLEVSGRHVRLLLQD